MSNFQIITDATADLPADLVQKLGVHVIPMTFNVNGMTYTHTPEEKEMKNEEFYQALREGASVSTTQITPFVFESGFRKILKQGQDVLCIPFSSGLSGTYQSAVMACDNVSKDYPERKIICVDSLCASIGLGVLLCQVVKFKEQGMRIEEISTWITDHRLEVRHWFCVDDLNHLKKGGRISSVEAAIGTALKIKPILSMNSEGHLVVKSKARGTGKALSYLVNKLEEEGANLSEQTILIGHADAPEAAEILQKKLKEKGLENNVVVSKIGPIIGSHVGPGMAALAFIGKNS